MMLSLVWLAGCPAKYPACNNDKDCHPNEYCVNQQCQQCRDDKDCSAGETCNKGRCEKAAPKPCGGDSDCPADQSCVDGVCKPCVSDNQCGEGGKCQGGRCKRAPAPVKMGEVENPNPNPGPCALEPVYFDFNESALSTEATSAIERDADCIKKANGKTVTLVGRTDPRGTEEYNLALSDKRAQAVKDRLSRLGADNGGHFKVVPKGELEATGTDETGWAKDRRVDFQW
jgi:peptidoglycan-associated lipoprotein